MTFLLDFVYHNNFFTFVKITDAFLVCYALRQERAHFYALLRQAIRFHSG